MRTLITLTVCLLAAASPVWATGTELKPNEVRVAPVSNTAQVSSLEKGVWAFRAGDYKVGLEVFETFAKQGNALAQFNLGAMYDNGRGVPQNYVQAVAWYRKAAA